MKRRRPWCVRAWGWAYNDYRAASFATEERAMARAKQWANEGYLHAQVWQADPAGYVVGERIIRVEADQ